jgi:hypothetical protein
MTSPGTNVNMLSTLSLFINLCHRGPLWHNSTYWLFWWSKIEFTNIVKHLDGRALLCGAGEPTYQRRFVLFNMWVGMWLPWHLLVMNVAWLEWLYFISWCFGERKEIHTIWKWNHNKTVGYNTRILGPHKHVYGNQLLFPIKFMVIIFWNLERRGGQVPILKVWLFPITVTISISDFRKNLSHSSMSWPLLWSKTWQSSHQYLQASYWLSTSMWSKRTYECRFVLLSNM